MFVFSCELLGDQLLDTDKKHYLLATKPDSIDITPRQLSIHPPIIWYWHIGN